MTAAQQRYVIPLLIVAGTVGFYFYQKSKATVAPGTDISDADSGSIQPELPPPPVYDSGLDPTLVNQVITHQNETQLTTYYNTVYSLPAAVFTKIQPTMSLLRANGKTAELKACADYITQFLSKGLPLTRSGNDIALYDQVVAIHNTYGIF